MKQVDDIREQSQTINGGASPVQPEEQIQEPQAWEDSREGEGTPLRQADTQDSTEGGDDAPPAPGEAPPQAGHGSVGILEDRPITQRRQDQQAQRSARQEQRKAQQEARAQERRQARQEAQEAHQAQQQEKRQRQQDQWEQQQAARQQTQDSPRRLGTLTLGITLVAMGAVLLSYLFFPNQSLRWLGWLAPALLILLGVEVLVRYALARERRLRYDLMGGFLTMVLAVLCLVLGSAHQWMPYVGQARHQAQEQFRTQLEEQVYQALKDQPQVANVWVDAYAQPTLTPAGTVGEGYEVSAAYLHLVLMDSYDSKEAFGADCYRVMERLAHLDILDQVDFRNNHREGETQYQLNLQGKFQRNMGEAAMTSQVEVYTPRTEQPELPLADYQLLVEYDGQDAVDQWLAQLLRQRQEYLDIGQEQDIPEEVFTPESLDGVTPQADEAAADGVNEAASQVDEAASRAGA